MKYTLEICTDSVASAVAAQKGGAKLCSGLVIGGLSPDPALFKVVRANTDLEIRTLLRPRFGDFCYDEYEFEMLKEEVQMYREFGADGIRSRNRVQNPPSPKKHGLRAGVCRRFSSCC